MRQDEKGNSKFQPIKRSAPIGTIPEPSAGFETKVRCITCPNCKTSNCYEHTRELSVNIYCTYCSYEESKKNAKEPAKVIQIAACQ